MVEEARVEGEIFGIRTVSTSYCVPNTELGSVAQLKSERGACPLIAPHALLGDDVGSKSNGAERCEPGERPRDTDCTCSIKPLGAIFMKV